MPIEFVSDYEALTGETVEAATRRLSPVVETKVVSAPETVDVAPSTVVVETA